jgi:ATP-dependent exoDNAse (exonuclease V) alpha subunit
VISVQAKDNLLTVLGSNGEQTTYDPRRQMGVSVYRAQEKAFAAGDRIQFTAPNQELKVANRELGSIENIAPNGSMQFKLDSGRSVEFAVQSFPHLDHGYAVTSHSSQGQTAERVLIHVDTELGSKDLLNRRMAYVSVSRGQWDAQIFTNDREKLSQALSHDVSHKSAFQPQQEMLAAQQKIGGPSSERVLERSMGYGLGL